MDLITYIYTHISLGSNCSITYQLETCGLRTCSYPFDWTRISINQLIKVLESDFESYSKLDIKYYSPAHSSLLLVNDYGVQFAHELIEQDKDKKNKLEESIQRRIGRFRKLQNSNVKFYRIELSNLNPSYANKLNKLCELISLFVTNFQLVLLIQEDSWDCVPWNRIKFINQIQIIKFKSFDPDWKMEQIDWKEVFGINSVE